MTRVCVFCGSSNGAFPEFEMAARTLGQLLAARGAGLVYGGAHVGLMGIVADTVLAAGGEVIGVIPRSMVDREIAHTGLTRLEIVETMHERKARMAGLAGAFISLPGAYGTLDEMCEILTWAQLGLHRKPIGLWNVRGCYNALLQFLDGAVLGGFLKTENRALLIDDTDPQRLLERMGLRYNRQG